MKLAAWVLGKFRHPDLISLDLDSAERFHVHRKILQKKRTLTRVFEGVHRTFRSLADRHLVNSGLEVEIGAGVSPMHIRFQSILSTDIEETPINSLVVDAECMPFTDGSVGRIYMKDTFHHLSNPQKFFDELDRVLIAGGGVVMYEPFYNALSAALFSRLFESESFDKASQSWRRQATGPMSGANQALSYIVFFRDRNIFDSRNPRLRVVSTKIASDNVLYLCSGGLNFRQLVPNSLVFLPIIADYLLNPFRRWFGLHHFIVVKKIA